VNAVEYIRQNVNIRKVLEYYNFQRITETEDMFRCCCAIHGGHNPTSFVWRKDNQLWYCYSNEECGGGDIFNLIEKLEHIPFQQTITQAAKILGLNILGMSMDFQEDAMRREQKRWIELQRKHRKPTIEESEYHLPDTEYFDDYDAPERLKNFPLKEYDAKFCKLYPIEKSVLRDKLVIPIYQKGKLCAVALRDTTGTFSAKWMYQPKGVKMQDFLYNFDRVVAMVNAGETEEVILVEGIFDVWAYHRIGIENVVAIFGSSLSEEQYKILLKLNVTIVCSFDSDVAGEKCTAQVVRKMQNKCDLKFITLPEGNDPDDCTEEELLTAYLNRK